MNIQQQLFMSNLSASTLCHNPRKKPLLALDTYIIPDDVLLSNIFIRLEAKQVAQMRSLSKTWNSLLSHPSFIKSHLDHSKDTNDEILLVFQDSVLSENRPFTAHTTADLQLTNKVKVPHMNSLHSHVVGAVNGLICLRYGTRFTIWNPSLSASTALPPYSIDSDEDDLSFTIRFGFDPKTNDYKVVKLMYNIYDDDNIAYNWFPVEVFSVLKGSWESITERFPSHVETIVNMNEFVVDGHDGRLHYLCRVKSGSERTKVTILAFDLGDETFSEIALPDSIQDHLWRMELGVLSGKLCLMLCFGNGICEVWVMENYGVATSWVKRHVIPKYKGDDDIFPIGFTLNNQFVFGHGIDLSLYDTETSTFRDFKGAKPFPDLVTVVPYVDSLVWVTPKWAYNDVCISSSQIVKKQHLLDA